MPMFTDHRLVQCPHLTVTMSNKLLHGTLTCILTKHQLLPPNQEYPFHKFNQGHNLCLSNLSSSLNKTFRVPNLQLYI
ncbi:hypothetical protein Hanom_Chr12g01070781 [Helianthus anomalus]